VVAAASFEAMPEIVAAKKRIRLAVMVFDHLEHLDVNPAALHQARQQRRILKPGRKETVLKRLEHFLSSTGLLTRSQRAFTNRLTATAHCPILV
jgi:hypothetical protein